MSITLTVKIAIISSVIARTRRCWRVSRAGTMMHRAHESRRHIASSVSRAFAHVPPTDRAWTQVARGKLTASSL
eukprot:CAMPEP_0173111314 /NCGR_PEP_ID=MMETSP1102-20130122/45082_1 /TAXON_ID=49646 /ORGANISM="Geminigera sp., Strain Caron Lab Isolate" /LENGTH=73 /DNA_ID=CAMNT_0014011637 /DNA_START=65 /DNA_END=283 /DNA_ORIENTATION=+